VIFSIAIVAIVTAYTWVIDPITPGWVTPIPVAAVIGLSVWHAVRRGDWGFNPAALLPALWQSAALTIAAAAVMYFVSVRLGTWHDRHDSWTSVALLIPWALGQQFALQTTFLREAESAVGTRAGIVLAAALFAALHLPNPFLTAMTFAGALAWCWIYARHPNLLPLSVSHALLTLTILSAFDEATTGHLRVGMAYLSL
jgi:membrane protease YdiL (CAAX protease family)